MSTVARQSPSHKTFASLQSGSLAVLNDRTITLDDIDPRIGGLALGLEVQIAAVRNRILAEQIDVALLEAEAAKRRIPVARLFAIEVTRRTVDPTAEEIQAIYNANRAQFGTADVTAARPNIVSYLRRERAQKLTSDFTARLRKRYAVIMGADVNSPNLKATTTLATVAGRAILAGPILERLKPIVYDLRFRVYEAVKGAVEQLIYDMLVLAEARRVGVDPEVVIRKEITDKQHAPGEEEIAKFFDENKGRITGDLAAARGAIVSYLEEQARIKLETSLSETLRKRSNVRILLQEPEPPVLAISTDDDPSRGPVDAPVTVVVFTDFQCPVCGNTHPIIDDITRSFGNRVRLVIRDFPLDIHANAPKAAEAANAAFAQGKFFEYAELLFKNQKALDILSLKQYASDAGLNRTRFDAALDAGTYELEVNHDIADAVLYGVASTPTVFVNGVRVNGIIADSLRAAIERALGQKKASNKTSPVNTN